VLAGVQAGQVGVPGVVAGDPAVGVLVPAVAVPVFPLVVGPGAAGLLEAVVPRQAVRAASLSVEGPLAADRASCHPRGLAGSARRAPCQVRRISTGPVRSPARMRQRPCSRLCLSRRRSLHAERVCAAAA
jgi:hypothetical protein